MYTTIGKEPITRDAFQTDISGMSPSPKKKNELQRQNFLVILFRNLVYISR